MPLYPSPTLFPSPLLAPGSTPGGGGGGGGGWGTTGVYAQPIELDLDGLILTATDDFGVDWMADTLTGWYGSPASSLQLTQKPREPGAWKSISRQLGARVVTIAGATQAPSPKLLRDAMDRLNAAVALDGSLLTVSEDVDKRFATVYRQDQLLENRVSDYLIEWSMQVAAPDPRKYAADLTATTRLPLSSGDWTFPSTFPFSIDSVNVSGTCTLTNPGNIIGPVRLRIDGPCAAPQVTHKGTGLALTFASSLTLGVGEWLDIDMEAQTVLANGQVSRSGYVINRGWSGFEPGQNIWAFTAASYNSAAKLTVIGSPAWL